MLQHQHECAGSYQPTQASDAIETAISAKIAEHARPLLLPLARPSCAGWAGLLELPLQICLSLAGTRGAVAVTVCKDWRWSCSTKRAPVLWLTECFPITWHTLQCLPVQLLSRIPDWQLAAPVKSELPLYAPPELQDQFGGAQEDNLLLIAAARKCTGLRTLCVSGVLHVHALHILGTTLHQLRQLELNYVKCDPDALVHLFAGAPLLEVNAPPPPPPPLPSAEQCMWQYVDFGRHCCSDVMLRAIARHCRSFRGFESDQSPLLTSAGLMALARGCPSLQGVVCDRSAVCV